VCSHAIPAQKVGSAAGDWECLKQLGETVRRRQKGENKWKLLPVSLNNILGRGKSIHWALMAFILLLRALWQHEQL